MPTLVSRASARRELAEIAAHVGRAAGDREVGGRPVRKLDEHRRRLSRLPGLLGRPRPEFGRDHRTGVNQGYIVVFRCADLRGPRGPLIVIHVFNGRRDLDALFTEPEVDE